MPAAASVPFLPLRETSLDSEKYEPVPGIADEGVSQSQGSWRRRIFTWTRAYILVLHVLVAALIFALSTYGVRDEKVSLEKQRSWSPAQKFVKYELNEQHTTNHSEFSAYSGYPSKEQDDAWGKLLEPMFFNVSYEELRRSGESLDNLASVEEGGYSATIGVYHELHCLRQLRFYLFNKRYYPSLTSKQEAYLHGHLDHCIETLRLTVMCHGNTGLYSFAWHNPDASKPATQSSSKAVCVKWSSIDGWARIRAPPKLTVQKPYDERL